MKRFKGIFLLFLMFTASSLFAQMSESCQIAAAGIAEGSSSGNEAVRLFWTSVYIDLGC